MMKRTAFFFTAVMLLASGIFFLKSTLYDSHTSLVRSSFEFNHFPAQQEQVVLSAFQALEGVITVSFSDDVLHLEVTHDPEAISTDALVGVLENLELLPDGMEQMHIEQLPVVSETNAPDFGQVEGLPQPSPSKHVDFPSVFDALVGIF